MSPAVRLRNGIEIELASGDLVRLDGDGDSEITILSHAHGDHLVDSTAEIVASELTAALADHRREGAEPTAISHPAVDLSPAGHIAGSRAAKITDPATGRTYLYTGDCSTRDRFYLEGFDPPNADVLIIESTYGKPEYTFPPTAEVVADIQAWLEETMDQVCLLFGYALGRAQKIQRILAASDRDRVFITDAVAGLNEIIEVHLDVSFDSRRYEDDVDLQAGDVLVLPMQTSRLSWIESLIDEHEAVTAGFSGWASDQSFVYRRGLDEGFVLSDHCDFSELIDVVQAVDPERIYTTHGFTDQLASHLTSEYGYETRALQENQSTLADF